MKPLTMVKTRFRCPPFQNSKPWIFKTFNNEFSKPMTDRFEMSMMGELKFFLGFEIKQLSEGTFISQTKFTQDILKKFKMQDAKGKRFPMDTKCHLELNPKGVDVDQKLYRSMIGSLLYLCASRPDIVLSVGVHTPAPIMDAWEGGADVVAGSPLNPATLTRSYSPTYVT